MKCELSVSSLSVCCQSLSFHLHSTTFLHHKKRRSRDVIMNIVVPQKWAGICIQTHQSLLHKPEPSCHFSSFLLCDASERGILTSIEIYVKLYLAFICKFCTRVKSDKKVRLWKISSVMCPECCETIQLVHDGLLASCEHRCWTHMATRWRLKLTAAA